VEPFPDANVSGTRPVDSRLGGRVVTPSLARRAGLWLFGLLSMVLLGLASLWLGHTYWHFRQDVELVRERVRADYEQLLRERVESARRMVEEGYANHLEQTRALIQAEVDQAHAIASGIYEHHRGESAAEVAARVREVLRPVRFLSGSGYLFITADDGTEVLFADRPELEGQNLLHMLDVDGRPVVQDLLRIGREQGAGFYRYRWTKPGAEGSNHPKLTYVRRFEPFGWVIGTGLYEEDEKRRYEAQALEQLDRMFQERPDYLFVADYQGYSRAGPFKNRNMWEVENAEGVNVVQLLAATARAGGGFVDYLLPEGAAVTPERKFSYVAPVPGFDWYVGSGLPVRVIETDLSTLRAGLERRLMLGLGMILMALLLIAGLAVLGGRVAAARLRRYLATFMAAFGEAARNHVPMRPERLEYSEFRALAAVANVMIEEQRVARLQIERLAYADSLTGLANRRAFSQAVERHVAEAAAGGAVRPLAVLFLDLDGFKRINDSHGHSIGDQVLLLVAERLRSAVPAGMLLARLGGDEFALMVPDLPEGHAMTTLARRLLVQFQDAFALGGQRYFLSASLGVSLYPGLARDGNQLLAQADLAMYRAKRSGRNQFRLYDPGRDGIEVQLELEQDLRDALERERLMLHFQPVVPLRPRAAAGPVQAVAGVEALLRWPHPQRGFVSPVEFIPVAEASGLIVPIGAWVLREAMRQAVAWHAAGVPFDRIAVNLSGLQLTEDGLALRVPEWLNETGCHASWLKLEVTESLLVEHDAAAIEQLARLQRLGISIAIDDFGTGQASLHRLKQLPVDELKVDRAFVRDMVADPDDRAIVAAVVAMAHALELEVVAEGVETPDQMDLLREMRCDLAQGFGISRPIPAAEATAWLRAFHEQGAVPP